MDKNKIKRKNIRFTPDDNTLIQVEFADGTLSTGLAYSEAYGGCAGVFRKSPGFVVEAKCRLSIGDIKELDTIIRWVEEIDDILLKVGFEHL